MSENSKAVAIHVNEGNSGSKIINFIGSPSQKLLKTIP